MRSLRYRGWWLAGGILLLLLTLGGSLLPPSELPRGILPRDKWLHFTGYFVLAFWFAGLFVPRRYLPLALLLLLFGGGVEVAQASMRVGRTGEFADLIANGAGIATGLLAAVFGLGNWMRAVEQRVRR